MAYVREDSQLGINPLLVYEGVKTGSGIFKGIKNLFGGDLRADRATVQRWYDSMPGWAKQVISVDDLIATEQQSRGAGSIVQWSKDLNGTSLVRGNWSQADLNYFKNDLQIAINKASSEPDKHDFWVLNGTLVAAVLNVAQHGNPLGAQQPGQPPPTQLPPATWPTLPRGAQPIEITTPTQLPPIQQAGFGGMPTWLVPVILVGAGVGLFAMKGRR